MTCLAVFSDGRLASGSRDGTIRIWDLETDQSTVLENQEGPLSRLVILPDGRLVSRGWQNTREFPPGAPIDPIEGTIRVWDFIKGESNLLHGDQGVGPIAVLPDGRLASGDWDGTIKIWDIERGESKDLVSSLDMIRCIAA